MEAHRPDLIGRVGIAGPPEFRVRAVSSSGALTADDCIVVVTNGAANVTLTLPSGALRTVRGVTVGRIITIKRGSGSTGNVTINAPAGGTVQSCTDTLATYGATTALNTTNANSATFVTEGTNVWGHVSNG
jgi:hypothetical protein